MLENRGGVPSPKRITFRTRRPRITPLRVWALMGVALLAWGTFGEGQESSQQDMKPAQGPVFDQPRQWQAPALLNWRGSLVQSAVTIDGGKLSVSLRGAKLHDVMAAIARQSGIEISIVGRTTLTTLTESFSGLTLEAGLRRLLRGQDYLLMYAGTEGQTRISKVLVLARDTAPMKDSGGQPLTLTEVIGEAFNTVRFADTVEATITGAGRMTEADQALQGPGASELNATVRRLLMEGGGAALLDARLRRLLQQQRR